MRTQLRSASALVGLALLIPCVCAKPTDDLDRITPVAADEPIPLTDFFRPDLFTNPQLNDAGTCFAATLTNVREESFGLLLDHLDTNKVETIGGPVHYRWLDDDHLICQVWVEDLNYYGTTVVSVGDPGKDYWLENRFFLDPLSIPRDDRMEPLIWLRYRFNGLSGGSEVGVMSIDARVHLPPATGVFGNHSSASGFGIGATVNHVYPIPKGGIQSDYFCDKMGHLAFAETEKDGYHKLYRLDDDKWIECPIDLDQVEVLAVGDRPNELIVLGPREPGHPRAVQRMDAVTGTLGEELYRDPRYDPEAAYFYRHPVTRQIIGMTFNREAPSTVWFLPEYKNLQSRIERSLPFKKVIVNIMGSSLDEHRFVVSVRSDVLPVAYYQIDLSKGTLGLIKSTRPWIDPARMHPMRIVSYKTRDGHEVEGFLVLPTGATKAHPAPLVVIPHDGPRMRDFWAWDAEAQFLADRGYAVFQPNYRGSPGYGWQYPLFEEWRFEKMPSDVIDGVKRLLGTGLIDKDRIAAMGDGFGAYIALRCMEEEPTLFRCGVLMSGTYDWTKYMSTANREFSTTIDFDIMKRHLGDPTKEAERFTAMSALRQIDRLKAPVFVSYYNYMIVEEEQGRALLSALENHHISYEKVVVGSEFRRITFKRAFKIYAGVESFLAQHLK